MRGLILTPSIKIFPLPDFIEIYPTHFSGSSCGKGLSGKPSSTLAFEKRFNRFLSMNEGDFVRTITTDLAEKPAGMMITIAKKSRPGLNPNLSCNLQKIYAWV